MATKYESAKLILELYDLRRESKLREARDWWFMFKPKTMDDINAAYKSPDSAKFRMVMGYWDMALALVNHGAIDETMFNDTNGEFWLMFAKMQQFLPEIRKTQSYVLVNTEKFIMKQTDAQKKLDHYRAAFG